MKLASRMWCELRPQIWRRCKVMPALVARAMKNSSPSSVSKLPTCSAGMSRLQWHCPRPETSMAAMTQVSSIGRMQEP